VIYVCKSNIFNEFAKALNSITQTQCKKVYHFFYIRTACIIVKNVTLPKPTSIFILMIAN